MFDSAAIAPLVISAPFGNYVQPAGATPTLGTFTAERRPGRIRRVLQTVRYYRRLDAWVNRIGLRNPGVDWLVRRAHAGWANVADKIVSVHGFNADEWWTLLDKVAALEPLAIELNMSCPNVGEVNWPDELFERAVGTGQKVIVKLPPINFERMAEQALDAGVRAFHCCNTLPVPGGGLSGAPLKPLSLHCIHWLRQRGGAGGVMVIGGGGIRQPQDIADYREAGADRFAVGTKVMHPRYLFTTRDLSPLIEAAERHTAQSDGSAPDAIHEG